MNIFKLLIIGLGGGLGSIARYITVKAVDEKLQSVFPYGTFTVNIVGSFIIGILFATVARKTGGSEGWALFLGTGFCGGFTTFSAFALENISLINQRMAMTSILYIVVSVALGLLAVAGGIAAARSWGG